MTDNVVVVTQQVTKVVVTLMPTASSLTIPSTGYMNIYNQAGQVVLRLWADGRLQLLNGGQVEPI